MEYSGYVYHCSANESFDGVALALYGDEKYAAELMGANPHHCGKAVFNGGEHLILPEISIPRKNDERALANTIAPWKT